MNHHPYVAAGLCLATRFSLPIPWVKRGRGVRCLLSTLLLSAAMSIAPSAFAGDACKTVLCMYGKFTGNSGGSACSSAVQDYFSIVAKKHGKINWGKTAALRGEYLNSCPGADSSINNKVNAKFGKVMG